MSEQDKPREFWIDVANEEHGYYEDEYGLVYSSSQDSCTKMIKPIHVIEHSAYDAIEKENEELVKKCGDLVMYQDVLIGELGHGVPMGTQESKHKNNLANFIAKERDSLRESLKLAVEALTIISGKHETLCVDDLEDARFDAEQTLATIKAKGEL